MPTRDDDLLHALRALVAAEPAEVQANRAEAALEQQVDDQLLGPFDTKRW